MPETKRKKKKFIFLLLRITFVTTGIVLMTIWASRQGRWRKLTEINADVFAVALGIFVFGQILVGLRWWLLLRSQSIFIPFWAAVKLHFLGLFYNNCMPGSVGGDIIRAVYVTRHTDKKFEAALSVFVDRAIGLLSTLLIACFFYFLFLRGQSLEIGSRRGGLLSLVARYKMSLFWLLLAGTVILIGLLLHGKSRSVLAKAWSYLRVRMLKAFEKFKNAVIIYCKKPLTMLAAFGLTVFLQITTITGFWLVGRNLGITASIKYYYVFFTLTWVFGAVPISIGGAVVVEGILIFLFKIAGVPEDSVFALALCQRFVWILASLPGAVIHLFGIHLPKDFFVDYNEPIK